MGTKRVPADLILNNDILLDLIISKTTNDLNMQKGKNPKTINQTIEDITASLKEVGFGVLGTAKPTSLLANINDRQLDKFGEGIEQKLVSAIQKVK
jgi:hypothetical protein